MRLPLQLREAAVDAIDRDSRVVHFSFSSSARAQRHYGWEILDHSVSAIDTIRLDEGVVPLLINHDFERHVGRIISYRIGATKAYGTAKLSTHALAEETLLAMKDGTRPAFSVGYLPKTMVRQPRRDGDEQDTFVVTNWEILEISSVSCPLDPSAHLRDYGDKIYVCSVLEPVQEPQIEPTETRSSAVTFTYQQDQIEPTPAVPTVNQHMLSTPVPPLSGLPDPNNSQWKTRIDASPRHQQICKASYSLRNVIEKGNECDGIERSISNQLGRTLGVNVAGILCPMDVLVRDLSVTASGAAGGDLVETHLAPSVKDILRNFSAVAAAGAQVISGLVGNFFWPRFATGSSPTFINGENVMDAQNTVSWSALNLVPLRMPVELRISRQLLVQASYDVEAMLRETILRDVASVVDGYCLTGSGSAGQILGVLNMPQNTSLTSDYSKLSVATAFGGPPSWAALTAMQTSVFSQNVVPDSSTSWIVSPAAREVLMTTPKISGFPYYLMEDERIAGYRAFTTNDLSATNQCVFGNFNNAVICLWALDICSNPYSLASTGQIQLVINVLANFGLIRGVGLTISSDSAAQ